VREPTQTDDDLAVMAAKENLASLASRTGYHEAMHQRGRRSSRAGQLIAGAIALAIGALAVASWIEIDAAWLRIALGVVLGGLAALAGLLCLGMSPGTPPQRWGVAVVGKRADADHRFATLLREDGSTHEVPVVETIHAMLRAGDCGVAEVTCLASGTPVIVVAFYRL
jgi:hypothetical protein